MTRAHKGDRAFMKKMGVSRTDFQDVLIKKIPCGIESVKATQADATSVQINAPRALMVLEFKGFFQGLIQAEKILKESKQ